MHIPMAVLRSMPDRILVPGLKLPLWIPGLKLFLLLTQDFFSPNLVSVCPTRLTLAVCLTPTDRRPSAHLTQWSRGMPILLTVFHLMMNVMQVLPTASTSLMPLTLRHHFILLPDLNFFLMQPCLATPLLTVVLFFML